MDAEVAWGSWQVPKVFDELARIGEIPLGDMLETFNLGLGMIAAVAPSEAERVRVSLSDAGIDTFEVGHLVSGIGTVRMLNLPG